MTEQVRKIFEEILPSTDNSFEVREDQVQFSEQVAKTMEKGDVLIAEAGTGIGKSFAYLVPALQRAVQGQQVVIVTATIALQHQLADKDIPQIQKLLGTAVPVTVLKGRSNYLCRSRLKDIYANEGQLLFQTEGIDKVNDWAKKTTTGDKEELQKHISVSNKLWSEINTHEYSCGGRRCQERGNEGCFYVHVRRKVKQSGIIITNYNLLVYHLLHIINMEENKQEDQQSSDSILPTDAIYVLDEAHNFRDITRKCLTVEFNKHILGQMYEMLFGKKGMITIEKATRGGFENSVQQLLDKVQIRFQEIIAHIEQIDAKIHAIQQREDRFRYASELSYEDICQLDSSLLNKFSILHTDLQAMIDTMSTIQKQFEGDDVIGELISRHDRWWTQMSSLTAIYSENTKLENMVRWCYIAPKSTVCTYSVAPLFVSKFLNSNFFKSVSSVICTSATITVQHDFEYWMKKNGAPEDSKTLLLPSPFPFESNVLMIVPKDAPSPKTEYYIQYLIEVLPMCLDIAEGRALILCTSYQVIKEISQVLKRLEFKAKWNLLVQDGTMGVSTLANKFREDPHSVLVATASFWEGFDAPGDTLQLLIITRIPFTSPSNLFFKEEANYLHARNIDAFSTLSVPEAELRLRQGFGRLMRSSKDRGVVFITDTRIYSTEYGKKMALSLPKCMVRVDNTKAILQEMSSYFKEIRSL